MRQSMEVPYVSCTLTHCNHQMDPAVYGMVMVMMVCAASQGGVHKPSWWTVRGKCLCGLCGTGLEGVGASGHFEEPLHDSLDRNLTMVGLQKANYLGRASSSPVH